MNIQTSPGRIEPASPIVPATEQPIRATYLSEERLRALGESLASGDVRDLHGLQPFDFQKRIRESARKILEVYRSVNAAQGKGETITPAAQWMLDNNYMVEETIYQIKRDLPRRFYRQLPTLKLSDGTSVPRALAIAWAYVAHSDSSVSASMFKAIVEGFQSVEPMKIGEIWALPSLLRFVLIENLRRLAVRVARSRDMRTIANDVADKVLADRTDDDRVILAPYAPHARDTTFATQLLYRLRDGSQNAGRALEWLEGELERSGTDAEEIILAEHQRQRHHRQYHPGPQAHQRCRLDSVVRGSQPHRRTPARAHEFRRTGFRLTRPVSHRDRGIGEAFGQVRIRGR